MTARASPLLVSGICVAFVASCWAISRLPCCKDPNEAYIDEGPCYGDGCIAIKTLLPCSGPVAGGCFCKCGYFRNRTLDRCVPTSECSQIDNTGYLSICGGVHCKKELQGYYENNECLSACPNPLALCSPEKTLGCYCLPNYRLSPCTNSCVEKSSCPQWKYQGTASGQPEPIC